MRRPVLPGDVSAVARALLAVGPDQRTAVLNSVFDGAALAQAAVEKGGALHEVWGNGSLDAAARGFALADEPPLDNWAYLCCMINVLQELQRRTQGPEGPSAMKG